jgi:hypothetical protein
VKEKLWHMFMLMYREICGGDGDEAIQSPTFIDEGV